MSDIRTLLAGSYRLQRLWLLTEARRALLSAVAEGYLDRDDADEALAAWGLTPVPALYPTYLTIQAVRTGFHANASEAIHASSASVHTEHGQALVNIGATVHEVTAMQAILLEPGVPGGHPYQVTTSSLVGLPVKATESGQALASARKHVADALAAHDICHAEQVLEAWVPEEGHIDDAPLDLDADAPYPPIDASAVTEANNINTDAQFGLEGARHGLHQLQRLIRAWLIDALSDRRLSAPGEAWPMDGALSRDYADQLLRRLDMPALPRAHLSTAAIELPVTLTAEDETTAARQALRHVAQTLPVQTHSRVRHVDQAQPLSVVEHTDEHADPILDPRTD